MTLVVVGTLLGIMSKLNAVKFVKACSDFVFENPQYFKEKTVDEVTTPRGELKERRVKHTERHVRITLK